MKRLCGFALFFFVLGICFCWLCTNDVIHVICVLLGLILSYCLFLH